MRRAFRFGFFAFVGLTLAGCGGDTGTLNPDAALLSSSISLTNGSGGAVSVIPAAGGNVTARFKLSPALDVDFDSARLLVIRDDSNSLPSSPAVMDYNAFTGEFSAALAVPANTAASARTYAVDVTARDSTGALVPFESRIGTFAQAAP